MLWMVVVGFLASLGVVRYRKRAPKEVEEQIALPIEYSVLIKTPCIPSLGIVCSKPSRTRFLKACLFDGPGATACKMYDFDWGLQVWVGRIKHIGKEEEIFLASVPMGDSGSYLAFRELFSRGAKRVCRLGSSDYRVEEITDLDSHQVILVECADNLFGVMRDGGYAEHELGTRIPASRALISAFESSAREGAHISVTRAICHNTANYHATNFARFEGPTRERVVLERWSALHDDKEKDSLAHTCDMESASLFLAARESGNHAITLLQRIRKTGAKETNNELNNEHLRDIFLPLILRALLLSTTTE